MSLNENISAFLSYFNADGKPTIDGLRYFAELERMLLRYSLASARSTATTSIAGATVKLDWDTIEEENDDVTISGTDATINRPGLYKFNVQVRCDTSGSGEATLSMYVDNVIEPYRAASFIGTGGTYNFGDVDLVAARRMDAGDVVDFRVTGTASGTLALVSSGTILVIERIDD